VSIEDGSEELDGERRSASDRCSLRHANLRERRNREKERSNECVLLWCGPSSNRPASARDSTTGDPAANPSGEFLVLSLRCVFWHLDLTDESDVAAAATTATAGTTHASVFWEMTLERAPPDCAQQGAGLGQPGALWKRTAAFYWDSDLRRVRACVLWPPPADWSVEHSDYSVRNLELHNRRERDKDDLFELTKWRWLPPEHDRVGTTTVSAGDIICTCRLWEVALATGQSDQRECDEITGGDRTLVRAQFEKFVEEDQRV